MEFAMPRLSGWYVKDSDEQQLEQLGQSGEHTLVTFPNSQESIKIQWQKATSQVKRIKKNFYFEDDENLNGIFFYEGHHLEMTYEYHYSHVAYNGKVTEKNVPLQTRDTLPCKYLVLAILLQKPEIQNLVSNEAEPTWSIHLRKGYTDEPGDWHNTLASCNIQYDLNLSKKSCHYTYRYRVDMAP